MRSDPIYTGPLRELIPLFVLFKRAQGYDYGYPILMRLREIDLFLMENGVAEPTITEEMHEKWCARRGAEKPSNQAKRISALCILERWLSEQMNLPGIFVDRTQGGFRRTQFMPYIFSEADITASFRIMDGPGGARDMRTLAAMFSLYYGCGLRKSEAQKLRVRDVDVDSGRIRILDGKNHESRIVVASASIRRRLVRYRGDYLMAAGEDMPFFHRDNGAPFHDGILYALFHRVMEQAGIRRPDNGRTPRIHDLRHTYAVRALEGMERKGFDLYVTLPLLSRSMGHRHVTETEYYLRLREEHFASILDKAGAHSPKPPIPRGGAE